MAGATSDEGAVYPLLMRRPTTARMIKKTAIKAIKTISWMPTDIGSDPCEPITPS